MFSVRAASLVAFSLVFTACGSKDDTAAPTGATGTCDDYQSNDLASVSSDSWPAGFAEALAVHQTVAGRYSVTDCEGNIHEIHLATLDDTDIQVVQQGGEMAAPANRGRCR